uniref:Uncharacterized protein n=1 Tax=Glossina palpalis gambiensis TaxID=67801 RepID=A0A1B0BV83_9MUSC
MHREHRAKRYKNLNIQTTQKSRLYPDYCQILQCIALALVDSCFQLPRKFGEKVVADDDLMIENKTRTFLQELRFVNMLGLLTIVVYTRFQLFIPIFAAVGFVIDGTDGGTDEQTTKKDKVSDQRNGSFDSYQR